MTKDEKWVAEQRQQAVAYLEREAVRHGGVGDWPAFHVSPYIAIWAVQSNVAAGKIGWWVATGDCPSDYISGKGIVNPRVAMDAFSRGWKSMAVYMKKGRNPPGSRIGTAQNRKVLGRLLHRRATVLAQWASDRDVWLGILDAKDLPNDTSDRIAHPGRVRRRSR